MSASEFDLRALIRQVAEETDLLSPADLAKEVFTRVGPDRVADALEQALPSICHNVISRHRWLSDPTDSPADQAIDDTQGGLVGGAPTSRKVAKIRAFGRELRQVISVGPDRWTRFGDATASELEYAISINLAHAAANTAAAAMKQRAIEQLREHAVTTPAELPETALAKVFATQEAS